jgi:hypothetical protein
MGLEEDMKKILDVVNKIDSKLDTLSARISSLEAGGLGAGASTTAMEHRKTPSEIAESQKGGAPVSEVEGRNKCPKCGSLNIGSKEDRSKAISYSGGLAIYGKKYYCKQCASEWQ